MDTDRGCCADVDYGGCCYHPLPIPLWKRILNKINPVMVYRRWRARRAFTKVIFPMVRRVYPTLIANEIVSVQPMTLPSGSLFELDFKYEKEK